MKIKVISRDEEQYTKEKSTDITKVFRNLDPALHPFEKPREYVRALNAVKLDKVFAKPFMGSLEGHMDSVNCMVRHPTKVNCLISGAFDGEIRIWDVAKKKTTWSILAHTGYTRAIAIDSSGTSFLSCGADKIIKHWRMDPEEFRAEDKPYAIFRGQDGFNDIDQEPLSKRFASASANRVNIWDQERSEPLHSYDWGYDSVHRVRYNKVETHLLASCMSDRGVVFIDTRIQSTLQKLILRRKTNSVSWNPIEPYVITTASDDNNLYTFDIRSLKKPLQVHVDHVSAVLDVDYSPTGKEFVTGSFDRTIRIFPFDMIERSRSREVYHTQRMQRIYSVRFSADSSFVFCGSDDTNIRIWKAQASKPIRPVPKREQNKLEYMDKLKEKYKAFPEVRSISEHRQLPLAIYKAKTRRHIGKMATMRKEKHIKERLPQDRQKRKKAIQEHFGDQDDVIAVQE